MRFWLCVVAARVRLLFVLFCAVNGDGRVLCVRDYVRGCCVLILCDAGFFDRENSPFLVYWLSGFIVLGFVEKKSTCAMNFADKAGVIAVRIGTS